MTEPLYAYQWNRNGRAIPGATGPTYEVGPADEGATITCTVTAANEAGSEAVTSAPTPVVGS